MRDFARRSLLLGLPVLALAAAGRDRLAAEAGPAVNEKRLALKGYDPVSYFTEGRPEQGSAEYQAAFDDATYWFKNAEHRAMFVADPDHYAPQFRGFCTVTLSHGQKYEADPEAWAIADGKLYVFGAKEAVPIFQAQTASIIEKASDNWAKLRNTP
jgi:YHS domain-containing protein